MRRVPSTRRSRSVAPCDVMPAGLSMMTRPSVTTLIIRLLFTHLSEQRLDACRARDGFIELEQELRRDAQPQRTTHAAAQVAGGARQRLHGPGAFGVVTHQADEDLCLLEVPRHFHGSH